MAAADKQKQSLYFSEETLREIMKEANRLDRSLSWIMQQAWRFARDTVRTFPSANGSGADPGLPSGQREQLGDSCSQSSDGARDHPSRQVLEFLRGKFDAS